MTHNHKLTNPTSWSNNWGVLQITGLILPIVAGIIVEIFTSIAVFEPTLDAFINFLSIFIIELSIPIWLLGLGTFIIISSTILTIKYINREERPDYEFYTSDTIFGVDWHWDWVLGDISNLIVLCPECSYQPFVERNFSRHLNESSKVSCDNCSFEQTWQYHPEVLKSRVIREIHRRIRM